MRIILFTLFGLALSGFVVWQLETQTINQNPSSPSRAETKKNVRLQSLVPPLYPPTFAPLEPENQLDASEHPFRGYSFPDSSIISVMESKPDPNGNFNRVKVIRTSAAYRMVRIEEKINKNFSSGEEQITKHVAMMAQELMVQLQPGYSFRDLALLTQRNGYKVLRSVPFSSVYLIFFDGRRPEALPQVQANLNSSKIVEIAEPDYISFI